jgi:NADPH:quinone reductase-like Zn-dependent oxidoreductase
LTSMRRVLTENGKCVMVGAPKQLLPTLARLLKTVAWSLLPRQKFTFFMAKIKKDDLTTLAELIKAGKLTPTIDRQYPLTEAAAALAYAEEGHARGKVVITFR